MYNPESDFALRNYRSFSPGDTRSDVGGCPAGKGNAPNF